MGNSDPTWFDTIAGDRQDVLIAFALLSYRRLESLAASLSAPLQMHVLFVTYSDHRQFNPMGLDDQRIESSSTDIATAAADGLRYYEARGGLGFADFRELWAFRDLFFSLALRDLQVQYRQTLIGVAWAVIRPLTLMVVFTTLFRMLGRIPAANTGTYAVSLYAGLLPWQLFATTLTKSTCSLVANESILTKVYFPRLILPLVPLAVGLIDFIIAFIVLLGLMLWYAITPTASVLMVPAFVMLTMLISFALGTWLSAANALYRDIEHAVPFVVQVGMFVSPVVYEMAKVVPEKWQTVYSINPMVGVLEGFRWALLGQQPFPLTAVALAVTISVTILVGGLIYFRRIERFVADRV
jgi:lipopolysaccharide transport system permease protein